MSPSTIVRDLAPELALDIFDGDGRVFDDVVDQPARNGHRVELQIGEDLGHLDAVRDVVLTRQALLPEVRALAEPIGPDQQLLVEALRLCARRRRASSG